MIINVSKFYVSANYEIKGSILINISGLRSKINKFQNSRSSQDELTKNKT